MVGNLKMKRSRALEEIVFILDTEWDLTHPDKADLILSKLEGLGMLPPLNENWMSVDECVYFYGPSWENDINTYPRKNVYRWESEDEEI